jgi:hypothetical protein
MLDRRQFAVAGLSSLALAPFASAQLACSAEGGEDFCEAGLKLGRTVLAQQRCQNWCWAACIEAIFGLSGYSVAQEEIVARLLGDLYCTGANGPMIVEAVNGSWMSPEGRFNADATVLIDAEFGFEDARAAEIAVRELSKGRPLIIGAAGHAMLLTAIAFRRDGNGEVVEVTDAIVRDPWPDNPNRRTLTWEETEAIQFLSAVRVG